MAITMHRAERKPQQYLGPHANTNPVVAPGSYSNTHQEPFKVEDERPVPFNSGADKICCPNLTTSSYTPGPGTYTGQGEALDDANGLGPTSFKSKVSRMGPTAPGSSVFAVSTIEKNPGPGTYSRRTEWELALKKPPQNALLPWREALDKTVPSIPPQKLPPDAQQNDNSMGADISNVAMRHTGERGDTVGPGEYDPTGDLTVPAQPQTSFVLGGPRKDRGLFEPSVAIHNELPSKDNPGPGAYDSKAGMSDAAIANLNADVEKNPTHQFLSKTQLAHQRKEAQERVIPGPGQYDIQGEIETQVVSARNYSKAQGDRTRFGSAVQRVGWSRDVNQPYFDPYHVHHVPGPGTYGSHGGTFVDPAKEKQKQAQKAVPGHRKKKYYGVHHPMIVMALQETTGPLEAFGSTDDRNCNKPTPQFTPAPWAYTREEARGQSMGSELREKRKLGRNGAFGTLADRFFGSPLAGREGLPDPGMDFDERYSSGAHTEPRSMFISQSPRPRDPVGPRETNAVRVGHIETPAPGAYMIEKEVNYRSPFRQPRSDHLSFGSGQSRFDIGRDIFDGHTAPIENPAPGEYDYALPGPAQNGAADIKDRRRLAQPVGCTSEQVGPGSYGSIDTGLLKKTFNVSTHAPVIHGRTPRRSRQGAQQVGSGM